MYRLYYQYKPDRIGVCLVTVHALLHIADSIEFAGPVWAYWAFAMERFCGRLGRAIKSRRHPDASMNTWMLATARLAQAGLRYDMVEELKLTRPVNTNCLYFSDENCKSILAYTLIHQLISHWL